MLDRRSGLAGGRAKQRRTHGIDTGIHFLKMSDIYKASRLDMSFALLGCTFRFPLASGLLPSGTIAKFRMIRVGVLQTAIITNRADRHNDLLTIEHDVYF